MNQMQPGDDIRLRMTPTPDLARLSQEIRTGVTEALACSLVLGVCAVSELCQLGKINVLGFSERSGIPIIERAVEIFRQAN